MAALGIQALVALFFSIPLSRRCKEEIPAFDFRRFIRRSVQATASMTALVLTVTVGVLFFLLGVPTLGYLCLA